MGTGVIRVSSMQTAITEKLSPSHRVMGLEREEEIDRYARGREGRRVMRRKREGGRVKIDR
jgi:hypothetical protein